MIIIAKAVFLDRDGTINIEVNYLYKQEDFEFIENTIEAIKIFHKLKFKVIVLTNQSGIARGYYTEDDVKKLHKHIDVLLANKDTYVDYYYYCPHYPEGTVEEYKKVCKCRKPKIGMIVDAVKDFDIDLNESIIIGDKEIDVQTGKNAGIGKCVLVRTGHKIDEQVTVADEVFDSLYEFAVNLNKYSNKYIQR